MLNVGNDILEVIEEEEKEFSLVSSLKSEDSNGAVFRGEKLHDMKFQQSNPSFFKSMNNQPINENGEILDGISEISYIEERFTASDPATKHKCLDELAISAKESKKLLSDQCSFA